MDPGQKCLEFETRLLMITMVQHCTYQTNQAIKLSPQKALILSLLST